MLHYSVSFPDDGPLRTEQYRNFMCNQQKAQKGIFLCLLLVTVSQKMVHQGSIMNLITYVMNKKELK